MRPLLIILFLVSPVAAQTRAELDSKYGPIEGNLYRIKTGIAVEVTFSEIGKAKTFRIIPDDPRDKDALLKIEDVRRVSKELAGDKLCWPRRHTEIKVPCPPRKDCKGIQEEWERATTLLVRYKDLIVYALITLAEDTTPAPGNIKLLPGYEHVPGCGIDTTVGDIKKVDGIEIRYDIGRMAGKYAMRYANSYSAEWTRTEQVGDDSVLIVLTKEKRIIATFEKAVANFTAYVASKADIDDFLKMILTYKPPVRK